jgi:D-alanyl-D-alanine carboxypeptidase
MMNATAKRLGMSATRFVNPNGLHDPQQVSSARDIGVLAATAFNEFPQYRHYYRQDYLAIGKRKLRNRNALLRMMASADGMKTGFTCPAGFNLVATAVENNRRLMAVVLGATSGRSRADWAQGLLASGFASAPSGARLGQIANTPGGSFGTTDMSSEACGRGRGAPLTSAAELKGHGVSLGRYQTRSDAKQVLDTWKSDATAGLQGVNAGIVRVPNPGGFAAMVWSIDQSRAQTLCATLRPRGAYCVIITPETFSQMAMEAKPKAKSAAKRKSKKKRKRK